ncbi:helix-turn-helix domain-containing protein [Natrinema caseinilyticum]|uniref:helix-turn-helix domain-containing protein n=1 Tax=Natrinema caseinilyticum TaxID=2961570 RepID=UPI0020C21AD9|nr:helix-turn-helix domain-containing protein [Natrinema caseinilyticum]
MSRETHVVGLSDAERTTLEWFVPTGHRKAEDITRDRILLKADEGLTDAQICEYLGCSIGTPHNARKNHCERGPAAIHRREYDRKMDGKAEAHSSDLPVANHQKDTPAGRFTSLPTNS